MWQDCGWKPGFSVERWLISDAGYLSLGPRVLRAAGAGCLRLEAVLEVRFLGHKWLIDAGHLWQDVESKRQAGCRPIIVDSTFDRQPDGDLAVARDLQVGLPTIPLTFAAP